MFNDDAGHSHLPTPGFVTGCPLCDTAKTARNQAIAHYAEALRMLSDLDRHPGTPTIRVNIAPIGLTGDDVDNCHSIDIPAKLGEALADAMDSMNAYLGSEPPTVDTVPTVPVDPFLEAELEEYCIGLDTDYLMDLAARDPRKAVSAFDLVTEPASKEQIQAEDSTDWDGEL